jgi:uncharacterized membrane protein YkoI
MKKLLRAGGWALAAGLWLCGAPPAWAGEEPKTIPIQQAPLAVQKAIRAEAKSAEIGDLAPELEDGKTNYTVTIREDGHERDVTVAADGSLVSKEVTLEEVPPAVRNTITSQLHKGTLESIEKTFDDDEIDFEVNITTTNGIERTFTVALDGKLANVQMKLEETPEAVRKTIETNVGTGKLEDVYHMFEEDETTYYAEFMRDGKERDMSVAEDGKLQSVQVFLTELPPSAQKTITDKIGAGEIVRIDKSFERRDNVLPYEVEGKKDGKPFNFSVAPRGKFLGMDD